MKNELGVSLGNGNRSPSKVVMHFRWRYWHVLLFVLVMPFLMSCTSKPSEPTLMPTRDAPLQSTPTTSPTLDTLLAQSKPSPSPTGYQFPRSMDPTVSYLFYLHGKIIEDQGIPAISPDYGEYEYEAILEVLRGHGFYVISEKRPRDTDALVYGKKVADQVTVLLEAGVPASNISIVGASKGAWIAIYASHLLDNDEINFVLLAICHPDIVAGFIQDQVILFGDVLSIYDSVDEFAGTCQDLFSFSEGEGISAYGEIVLDLGMGQGLLYKPLDAWVLPAVRWAKNDSLVD